MLPEVVSHYRIKRRLGAGGMGEVYLADDLTLKRQVAIKLLTSKDLTDDQARRNLLREAQAAASLDHPNICPVYEVGTDGDRSFIVMQYVEGETLAARLERGRPSPSDALDIAAQVADALAAAHRQGVVHRDVKPQNIVLTPEGRLKVLDFGLAKQALGGSSGDELTRSTTPLSGLAGTPPYMSPEQFGEEPVDGRSDLFSLGAVYYECLTGRRAFQGKSTHEVSGQVLHVDPPLPSSINDLVGPAHDELCRQLLAKAPEKRVQTGEEALRLMELARQSGTLPVRRPPEPPRQPVTIRGRTVAIGAAAAVVVVLSIYAAIERPWAPMLPTPPAGAEQRYERGVGLLHEAAYAGAALLFEQAVELHDEYPLAHARLAEALVQLDEQDRAQTVALYANQLVPDRSRLEPTDALYLDAITDTVRRDFPAAIENYAALVELLPDRPEVRFELGRAYEIDDQPEKALAEFDAAIAVDELYAPARVWRARVARSRRAARGGAGEL